MRSVRHKTCDSTQLLSICTVSSTPTSDKVGGTILAEGKTFFHSREEKTSVLQCCGVVHRDCSFHKIVSAHTNDNKLSTLSDFVTCGYSSIQVNDAVGCTSGKLLRVHFVGLVSSVYIGSRNRVGGLRLRKYETDSALGITIKVHLTRK